MLTQKAHVGGEGAKTSAGEVEVRAQESQRKRQIQYERQDRIETQCSIAIGATHAFQSAQVPHISIVRSRV